jgi:hypothetical protein
MQLQQAANTIAHEWPMNKVVVEQKPDSSLVYFDFITDSLNPLPADTIFRFELKEIFFPADSVADSVAVKEKPIYPSVFSTGKTVNQKLKTPVREDYPQDWITVLFFTGLILLAWTKFFFPRRLKQIFNAVFSRRHISQLIRDGNLATERIALALGLVAALSISLVLFGFAIKFTGVSFGGLSYPVVYLIISVSLIVLWFIRRLLVKLTGFIFKSRLATDIYMLNNLIFTIATGLVIFPLGIAWFYGKQDIFLYLAGAIMMISLVVRLVRTIIASLQVQTFSGMYIFLYFCTLEILPLAIGVKIIQSII